MRAPLVTFLTGLLAGPLLAQDPPIVSQGSPSYALRPGDVLEISVWGREEYSGRFQVDEQGRVHYPVLGEINAAALTVAEFRDTLRTGLSRLFTNPFVTVTPRFRITVLGEVRSPGLYVVDPTLSVLDIVALAGGATPVGNLNNIRLFRSGEEQRVSFEEASVRGQTIQQIGVRSGDQVMVPRRGFTRQDLNMILLIAQIGLSVAIFISTVN